MEAVVGSPGRPAAIRRHTVRLRRRRTLSAEAIELEWEKPPEFDFLPGQRIRLAVGAEERDYTLISAPAEPGLRICLRRVPGGTASARLSAAGEGESFSFSGPHGYFVFRPSPRRPVFVATGVGIAPFCAMAAAGLTGFTLLHGARGEDELYYRSLVEAAAGVYIPCLSRSPAGATEGFHGRVTGYIAERLPPLSPARLSGYDFYLCGSREMVRDATLIIDERFPDARVHAEIFFG